MRMAIVAVGLLGLASGCDFDGNAADGATDGDVHAPDGGSSASPDAATTVIDATPAPACVGRAAQPRDAIWDLDWDGVTRHARVHVPASYDPSAATPLVLNFHGYAMNAEWQEQVTHYDAVADAEGFIVVHADGTGAIQGWNAGDCCGGAALGEVDDVGFVTVLLDRLEAELCIDADRVYASGFSNGGFLAHRLACEIAPRLAAIAAVSGVMGIDDCSPGRPMPVMTFHGTSDITVPFDGSFVLGFRSEDETIAGWVTRNGCDEATTTTFDVGDAHCERHGGCVLGATVERCTLEGGGHQWPGGEAIPASGQVNGDLDATAAMWAFFADHPRP